MRRVRLLMPLELIVAAMLLQGQFGLPCSAEESEPALEAIGSGSSRAFRATDVDGHDVVLDSSNGPGSDAEFTVVCFFGVECPLARLYGPRLAQLAEDFTSRGVRFIGIDSNQQDDTEEIRQFRDEFDLPFPLVKDRGNGLADQFGARRTPEVFVVDRQLAVRYQGRIDDQYAPGVARAEPQRSDLRLALDQLVSGRPVSRRSTKAVGCLIGREKSPQAGSDVTFSNQVARVLKRHCVECHRPGEIGPFSLTEYDEVVGWADMMLEVVEDGRMPPWHASEGGLELANTRHMPAEDKEILRRWVASGAPQGDPTKMPEWPPTTDGWLLPRQPDLTLAMRDRPYQVPATGVVEYQYFVVDPGFTEDKWVTAAQVVPGDRSVVHHAIVFIRPPDGARFRGIGWLTAYVPGQRGVELPSGRARRVPAGSKLVFQMHYTPTGKVTEDLSQVGLVFADDRDVTHEMVTLIGIDQQFEIPPLAPHHEVKAEVRGLADFPDGELLTITPHMHVRGKSFELFARGDAADSEFATQPLLRVPRYDFNWQHTYALAEPLPLRSLGELQFVATFDNSPDNPFNPDPTQYVTWGDQTWEEMAVAFFDVAVPRTRQASGDRIAGSNGSGDDESPLDPAAADRFVQSFLKRFDSNGDGRVERHETPIAIRTFGFKQLDTDRDNVLTSEELRAEYTRRRSG